MSLFAKSASKLALVSCHVNGVNCVLHSEGDASFWMGETNTGCKFNAFHSKHQFIYTFVLHRMFTAFWNAFLVCSCVFVLRQRKHFAQCSCQFSYSHSSIEEHKWLCTHIRQQCNVLHFVNNFLNRFCFTQSFESQSKQNCSRVARRAAVSSSLPKCCSHKIYQKYLSLFIWFMERGREQKTCKLFGNRLAHTHWHARTPIELRRCGICLTY